jgi:formate dehydrogenase maturation protein FdhE
VTKVRDKKAATERSMERHKQKALSDEESGLKRLQLLFQEKNTSNKGRVEERLKQLHRAHQKEIQQVMQQQTHSARQRGLDERMAAAEWQATSMQLQEKQNQRVQDTNRRGEEMERTLSAEFKREQEKCRMTSKMKISEGTVNSLGCHRCSLTHA